MTTPFVATALAIWDSLVNQAHTLMGIHAEAIKLRIDAQGAHLDNQGDVYARQRHIQAGGQASANALAAIEQAAVDLRAHLRPMTILGAEQMVVNLYPHLTCIAFGPWGHHAFIHVSQSGIRATMQQVWSIAEQDGTGPGSPIALNIDRGRSRVFANDPQHAKAIFTALGEDVLAYVPTGRTEARMPGFTLPHSHPHVLPDALWNDLWSALGDARKAGLITGHVDMVRAQGAHRATMGYVELTPKVAKKLGDPNTPGFVWDAGRQTIVDRMKNAVTALHAACRAAAPVLTALDGWAIDPTPVGSVYATLDWFHWSRTAQKFELLGSAGGEQWQTPHPVFSCNEVRFRYTLERALGALSTITTVPTRAWTRPYAHFGGGVVPGDSLAEAGLLAAALASGNKPGFVPGAPVKPADFITPRDPQDVWVEVERF